MERGANRSDGDRSRLGKRHARSVTYGSGVAAVLLGLMVLVSPLATATPVPAKSVTLTAPYVAQSQAYGFLDGSGCGYTVAFPVAPVFNVTNGVFSGSVKLTEKSCGSDENYAEVELAAYFVGGQSFQVKSNGTYSATVHWTLKYSVSLAGHSGGSGQFGDSGTTVSVSAYLEDTTNETEVLIGGASEQYANSSSPTTHSYTEKLTVTDSTLELVAGHMYFISPNISVYVDTEVSAGKSSASVSVNMGSGGESGTLTSIVEPS